MMLKKILYLLGYLINQTADKLLDFYWIFYIYSNRLETTGNKRESLITALVLLITLTIFKYVVFLGLKGVFKNTNHYNLYIFSYSIAFVIILLINKLPIDFIIIFLMPLKEFYSAFRVIANKSYLNGVAYERKSLFIAVNLLQLLAIPLAGIIMLLVINAKISDQIFTFFALMIGPSMIIIYNIFSKNHLDKTEVGINISPKQKIVDFIIEKIIFMSFFGFSLVCLFVLSHLYKGEVIMTYPLAIGIIVISAVIVAVVQIFDKFKVISHKYIEFDNKLLEVVFSILGLLALMVIA
jgi:hypothetical protein